MLDLKLGQRRSSETSLQHLVGVFVLLHIVFGSDDAL